MKADKESLINKLRGTIRACGDKKYYWIDEDDLVLAIYLKLVKVVEKNTDQKDGTYKTVAEFEEKKFVYVGEKVY